jgi:cobalt-zinc-cadmium efflux system outer membrane protein
MAAGIAMRAPLVLALVLAAIAPARSADPPDATPTRLALGRLPDDAALARLLWARSPDLVAGRTRIAAARADAVRAGLLPNPTLDGSWNTIPVGQTTPANLDSPMTSVPNYAVSVAELVEIGKRGPRQDAARHALLAATLDVQEQLRQRYWDLRDRIAEVAAAQARIAALGDVVADAHRLGTLQQERTARGDAPGIDADRALLDADKYGAMLADERQQLAEALAACTRTAGVPCEPFADATQAGAYLAHAPATPDADLADRPDLRALAAEEDRGKAAMALARARRIPDPTLRVGYVYDQFVAAGNQRNSLFAGVSLPLPVFDHGQADAMEAAAAVDAAARARGLLEAQGAQDLGALAAQARETEVRRRALDETSLPLARRVVATLDQVVAQGGASLNELLLARRSLGELLLDDADVRLRAFRIASARARIGTAGPPAPDELVPPR